MAGTILLLIAPGDDWWNRPANDRVARAAFGCWWAGATTAALLSPGRAGMPTDLPVPPELAFELPPAKKLPLGLRLWLHWRRPERIVIAGPAADDWAPTCANHGFVVEAIGQDGRLSSCAMRPTAGLPLHVA